MKYFIRSLFLVVALVLYSCSPARENEAPGIPSCISKKIESIKSRPAENPRATVYSYTYKGKTVYTISAPCCDQFSYLYDESCNILCAPSGGITGDGDGRCVDFVTAATNEKLVWKDNR